MANLNIKFNNKTYSIDSASLADATARLEAHLASMSEEPLEGTGAEYYTLAPTTLSFRSTEPLAEFQEVQVNGQTVDPANYTLEEGSTIVTFPIDYLKTLEKGNYEVAVVSENKTVKGGFTVAAPEVNNHGFYYNQPYTANLPAFGGDTAIFIREDETIDTIAVGEITDTGTYTIEGNNIVVTHPTLGILTCTISEDGTSIYCNEVAANFTLNGSTSITADEDYLYIYDENLEGYKATAINKTKHSYLPIKFSVYNHFVLSIGINSFANNPNLTSYEIQQSHACPIKYIDEGAFSGCSNLTKVVLPDSIISIGHNAFSNCENLTTFALPPNIKYVDDKVFKGCSSLTEIIFPQANKNNYYIGSSACEDCTALISVFIGDRITSISERAFAGCTSLETIEFGDNVARWNSLFKGTDWNLNVPATHVHCTDGDVAL
jgi:hypothetical protein